jgi:anti-sigma regulatory factor (Ser/Thr protein kinase)
MPWPLTHTLRLGPLDSAVPCARAHTRQLVAQWGLRALADDAELVVSELVTNALKANRLLCDPRTIDLRLSSDCDLLLVEVWDASTVTPEKFWGNGESEGGRGLVLVEALSEKWTYYLHNDGKVVWAILRLQLQS